MKTAMKKIALGTLATLFTLSAQSETYSFSVEIDSRLGEQPLGSTVTQPMNYPVLGVTDATKIGSYCLADGGSNTRGFDRAVSNESNSLCPNLKPDFFKVQFSGVKGAILNIDYSLLIQEKGGFRFARHDGNQFVGQTTTQLSTTDGTVEYPMYSRITLIDKTQVTDGLLDFTFDITAAYQ